MERLLLAIVLTLAAAAAPAEAARRAPCIPAEPRPRCTWWDARVTFVADGDTIRADVAGDGTRAERTIRFTGVNAMELNRYSSNPARRSSRPGRRCGWSRAAGATPGWCATSDAASTCSRTAAGS